MLDRYIVRNFLISAMMWFVVLMSLRVIVDLFVNIDEFAKTEEPFMDKIALIVSYYGHQSMVYFVELGGIIIVAAAAFSLAMMNHTNELTAMLASGVSLHRVAWPIILCAMLMGGLVILDQEVMIPHFAEKLVRDRDDQPGASDFAIRFQTDNTGAPWYSQRFWPREEIMETPVIILRDKNYNALGWATAKEARPFTLDGRKGWSLQRCQLKPTTEVAWPTIPGAQEPVWPKDADGKEVIDPKAVWPVYVYSSLRPEDILQMIYDKFAGDDEAVRNLQKWGTVANLHVEDPVYGMTIEAEKIEFGPEIENKPRIPRLEKPRFTFVHKTEDGEEIVMGIFYADSATWVPKKDKGNNDYPDHWELDGGAMFYPSDMTAEDLRLRQNSRWMYYMSSADISRLKQLKRVTDIETANLTQHIRIADPINNLIMLLLGLPFILSRERNLKASAAMCLLMVGAFYAFIQVCRAVEMPPTLSASLPMLVFGPIAAVMFDTVKT